MVFYLVFLVPLGFNNKKIDKIGSTNVVGVSPPLKARDNNRSLAYRASRLTPSPNPPSFCCLALLDPRLEARGTASALVKL